MIKLTFFNLVKIKQELFIPALYNRANYLTPIRGNAF
jgi:hypothetical protein